MWLATLLDLTLFLRLCDLSLQSNSTTNIITPRGTTEKIINNDTKSVSQVSIPRPKSQNGLPSSSWYNLPLSALQ